MIMNVLQGFGKKNKKTNGFRSTVQQNKTAANPKVKKSLKSKNVVHIFTKKKRKKERNNIQSIDNSTAKNKDKDKCICQ